MTEYLDAIVAVVSRWLATFVRRTAREELLTDASGQRTVSGSRGLVALLAGERTTRSGDAEAQW